MEPILNTFSSPHSNSEYWVIFQLILNKIGKGRGKKIVLFGILSHVSLHLPTLGLVGIYTVETKLRRETHSLPTKSWDIFCFLRPHQNVFL